MSDRKVAVWPTDAEFIERIHAGAILEDFAAELGVSRQRVHQVLTKRGISIFKVRDAYLSDKYRSWTPKHTDRVIAARLGLSIDAVRQRRKRMGLKRPARFTHGRSGHSRGCRCDICMMHMRHAMHVWYRDHPKGPARLKAFRSDKKPCALCEAEGATSARFRRTEQVCRYCGDIHEIEVAR